MNDWATDEEDSSTSSDWTEYEDSTLSDQPNADFLATFQSLPFDFNGHFPFFELPREIRDHVYSQVFETQIIDIVPSESYSAELGERYNASKLLGPVIWETLSVSHRFLREAISAFFSTSVFRFHDCGSFSGFIDSLPIAYRGAIRNLDFRLKLSTYQTGEDREQWQQPLEEKLLT